jgi:4-amino-4-deoxy-L-arabinose transferase-like glycosyltransferase
MHLPAVRGIFGVHFVISSFLSRGISFLERKNRPVVLVLIALYILAGVIYSFYVGDDLRYLPDEADYFSLATNLVTHGKYTLDGAHLTAYRPPGYPFFLTPFRFLGLNVVGLRILNYLALGLCIFFVYKMLQERFAPLAGLFAAIIVLAYPVVFYTAGTLYPQTLASLLLVVVVYLYTREPTRIWEILLGGLLAGWLVLTVPTFIFILAVLPVWSWLYQRRRAPLQVVPMLVVALLVVGAWSIRNFAVFDTFVFISSNSGENLLLGNSENTTPNGGRTIDISNYESQALGFSEIPRDQYFRNQAIDFILNHKLYSLKMYFLKFLNFFNYRNELVTNSEGSSARDLLVLVTYGPLLLVAFARFVFSRLYRLSSFEILLVAVYLVGALVSALFFTRIRFRVPFDFMLIMLVAVFIIKLLKGWMERSGKFEVVL